MGGAWDVAYDSIGLDAIRDAFEDMYSDDDYDDDDGFFDMNIPLFDDDDWSELISESTEKDESDYQSLSEESRIYDESPCPRPQLEAERLIEEVQSLSTAELAGYVSCLVSDEARRGAPTNAESFQYLSRPQQRVIKSAYLAAERLMEVQKKYAVDESISNCRIELGNCGVVTAQN